MIVIADDFAAFRRWLRSKLQENGFQAVAEASDGLEAVARATELQPDLVILDIGMPNLDGIAAAVQIRSSAPNSKILFVFQITDPEIVQSTLNDGAAGYLCKSKVEHEILPAIEAVLAGKRYISPGGRPTSDVSLAGRII